MGEKGGGCVRAERGGRERLAEYDVRLHSMTNLDITLEIGFQKGYISKEDFDLVRDYLDNAELLERI